MSLPENLGQAVDELAHSELAERALGKHIYDLYIDLKRKEWAEYRLQVHAWEIERYLAVL